MKLHDCFRYQLPVKPYYPPKRRQLKPQQEGASLVVALLVLALVSGLAVWLADDFDRTQHRAGNRLHSAQGQHYLQGAEVLAKYGLQQDLQHSKADHLGEEWAAERPPFEVDGGWILTALRDEQGRFNLNNLQQKVSGNVAGSGEATRFTEWQRRFIRLLQCFEEPALSEPEAIAITEAIIDWLDSDDETTGFGGAESLHYQEQGYYPSNGLMHSVSELRLVNGITPELYQVLQHEVAVLPVTTSINVNTASVNLLRSINLINELGPLSLADVQPILDVRQQAGFEELDSFLSLPVLAELVTNGTLNSDGLAIASDYFVLIAEADVAGRQSISRTLLQRQNDRVDIVRRRIGNI